MKPPDSPKRLFSVTLLALVVFVLAVVNLWRVPYTVRHCELLTSLSLQFPPAVYATLGGAWGVAWLVVAWGLWRQRDWARRTVLILMPIYQVFTLSWLAIFARSDYERGRRPFTITAAVLVTALTFWIATRPRVHCAFKAEKMEKSNDN